MSNGRVWTIAEDQQLADTIRYRESTLALADRLGRTHQALFSRAARIGLVVQSCPAVVPGAKSSVRSRVLETFR